MKNRRMSRVRRGLRVWIHCALIAGALSVMPSAKAAHAQTLVGALQAGLNIYKDIKQGQALETAFRQLFAVIDASRLQILNKIETLAVAEARACARKVVVLMMDLERQSSVDVSLLANDAIGCMALITELLAEVEGPANTDSLGFVLNTLGPATGIIAAFANRQVLFPAIDGMLRSGSLVVRARLQPTCRTILLRGDMPPGSRRIEGQVHCSAYNGDTGIGYFVTNTGLTEANARQVASEAAARNTSLPVAIRALSLL